ncbi:NUDIX domain-containing protein [Ornithinibacillus sp. BX22]|uniref:NUDIX domain-containing protein n=1 Tax=Ornithinibacillus hominis TaxID=2763055 RepID=A0A923L8Y5_9BACI|nr:NUDIX domain-containing protein [Ornithinibacillus hominis]MBC5638730.1 NUDIX domain-containing protein [Ornithinibacillus hominis]
MLDRASVVIIENQKVALIKRKNAGSVYYVFPGGGIEKEESPEDGARREAFEELGVEVKVKECIAEVEYYGIQYYFLSEIINGTFGTGQGEEYTDKERNRGIYLPVWVDISRLSEIDVKPKEVAIQLQTIFR